MTISFVPGEVNRNENAVLQGTWKEHHIIAYCSGNNVTIYTITKKTPNSPTRTHVQVLYLERDASAIVIDKRDGFILVAVSFKIIVYKPVNEFMTIPQWTFVSEFTNKDRSPILSLSWAPSESEIAVGSLDSLSLYYLYEEDGSLHLKERWFIKQPLPVGLVEICEKSNVIVTRSKYYSRFVKVWSRISYGDNSLFDMTYLEHPEGTFLLSQKLGRWTAADSNRNIDYSLANTKIMRDLVMEKHLTDQVVIYTLTNRHELYLWASYESNGRNHFKIWCSFNLKDAFGSEDILGFFILENSMLERTLFAQISESQHCLLWEKLRDKNHQNVSMLVVIDKLGRAIFYSVDNILRTTLSHVSFEKLTEEPQRFIDDFWGETNKYDTSSLNKEVMKSEDFLVSLNPLIFFLSFSEEESTVSVVTQNRQNRTMSLSLIDFTKIGSESPNELCLKRVMIFQGHTKSIRKLIKSKTENTRDEILFSMLNFPGHNYIWEPITGGDDLTDNIVVEKKFQIGEFEGLNSYDSLQSTWDAVVINDITEPKAQGRHHLIFTIEKKGTLTAWDCDPTKRLMNAHPIVSVPILENEMPVRRRPEVFFYCWVSGKTDEERLLFLIVAYDPNIVMAWRTVINTSQSSLQVSLKPFNIKRFPISTNISAICILDSFNSLMDEDVLSLLDENGVLRRAALENKEQFLSWKIKSEIHTNVSKPLRVQESAIIKKVAILDNHETTLGVWDTRSGLLEFEETFDSKYGPVRDLDWSFVSDLWGKQNANALLSVGFDKHVLLYTQLRYDYSNYVPALAILKEVDLTHYTQHDIGDLIWLFGNFLMIGCGNQFFVDDMWTNLNKQMDERLSWTVRQLMRGYITDAGETSGSNNHSNRHNAEIFYNVADIVRALNGPLPLFHPQFLIQCIYMDQLQFVKKVLYNLFLTLWKKNYVLWDLELDVLEEMEQSGKTYTGKDHSSSVSMKEELSDSPALDSSSSSMIQTFEKYDENTLRLLLEKLQVVSLPLLTRHQQITLTSIITVIDHIEENHKSIDRYGLNYILGFKLFQLSSKHVGVTMRDVVWALQSDNKDQLVSFVERNIKHSLKWNDIQQAGMAYWLDDERLQLVLETCVRNEFRDSQDPSGLVSLLFLTLQKKQVLIGLWKTVSHPDKQKLTKFLLNNFKEARWRTAALKNAFVLLSKHRYLDSAYFFLLGNSPKECCTVIADKVKDIALAIAVAKVFKPIPTEGTPNNCKINIMEKYVIPQILRNGDRWLNCWTFWELGMQDLSFHSLVRSPVELIKSVKHIFSLSCQKEFIDQFDSPVSKTYIRQDPVLVVLHDTLKRSAPKYRDFLVLESPQVEFDAVIELCSIYSRMGCDYLVLLLLKQWKFISRNYDAETEKKPLKEISDSQMYNGSAGDKENYSSISSDVKGVEPPKYAFDIPDMSAFNYGF